jgi:hypothetical protein
VADSEPDAERPVAVGESPALPVSFLWNREQDARHPVKQAEHR